MKKAMLLAAVLGFVCSAQALWVQWQIPSEGFSEGTISISLVNVGASTTFSQGDLLSVVQGSSVSGYTSVSWEGGAAVMGNLATGMVSDTIVQEGSYYLVLFNSSTNTYAYNSTGVSYSVQGAFQRTSADVPAVPLTPYDPGAYTTVTVPEPTALALLALGVAGLALRRRVA